MGKREIDRLTHISRKMSEPIELEKYSEETAERLTPVHIEAAEGARVTVNFGSKVNQDPSVPPIPKESIGRFLGEAFKQLPKGQKLAAYFGTLVFLAYLIASGTKLAGLW